jgi:hypothetical protein
MAALGEALQRAAAAQEYPELQRLTADYAAAEARHRRTVRRMGGTDA